MRRGRREQFSLKRSKKIFVFFLLPALIIYVVFMLYPLLSSLGLSFFSWNGYGAKTFVGMDNYVTLFTDPAYSDRFWGALKNNVVFFILTIVLQNAVALLLAAFLNMRRLKGAKFFRTIFYVPSTLSIIVVGFIWNLIYNPLWGPLNFSLDAIGLSALKTAWLGSEKTALIAISVANAWQYTGVPMIMFLAGMQAIPEELYEAASLDGAKGGTQFWKITFPLIAPVMFVVSVIVFVSNFSAFEIIYAMAGTTGAPNYSTDILGTFFYRICFGQRLGLQPNMGIGAAIASCMFVIIGVAAFFYFKYCKQEGDL